MSRIGKRAFSMELALYGPSNLIRTGKEVEGLTYAATPIATVYGRIDATSDANYPVAGLGQSNVDQMDTTDKLRLPLVIRDASEDEVNPDDGWYVLVVDENRWFSITGGSKKLRHKAKEQIFLVKGTARPDFIPAPPAVP